MKTAPVKTTHGSLVGRIDDGVIAYLGIPFAGSCAGDLRWRAPAEAPSWNGTREAVSFGLDPIQPLTDSRRRSPGISEDSLNLNIWRPADRESEPLPVMVYFTGASFMTVSGSASHIDGAAFARRGVVLVTFNYRANIFGFLAHPLLSAESQHHASGNYGLMDQIAALRWIKTNIGAFGGDPTRITAFGMSAGGASISLLLTSPLAAGLIDRAILHSPGSFRRLCSLADAEAAGSVAGTQLTEMRTMTANDLLAKIPQIVPKVRSVTSPRILRPMHDGYVVPKQESDAYDSGDFVHVPLIVGCTSDEGTWAVDDLEIKTLAEYRAYMHENFREATAEALEVYPANSDADVRTRLAEVFGETQFTYGTRSIARASSRYQPKTFRYLWRKGSAIHTDDLRSAFGNLPDNVTDVDRRISKMHMTAWTRFAATGDPNGDGVPEWPAYESQADEYLEIGERVQPGNHWRTAQLDFIDRYLRSHRNGNG